MTNQLPFCAQARTRHRRLTQEEWRGLSRRPQAPRQARRRSATGPITQTLSIHGPAAMACSSVSDRLLSDSGSAWRASEGPGQAVLGGCVGRRCLARLHLVEEEDAASKTLRTVRWPPSAVQRCRASERPQQTSLSRPDHGSSCARPAPPRLGGGARASIRPRGVQRDAPPRGWAEFAAGPSRCTRCRCRQNNRSRTPTAETPGIASADALASNCVPPCGVGRRLLLVRT